MPSVELSDQEWAQVMGLLSTAPWRDANPLLMKMGAQLQAQSRPQVNTAPDIRLDANGKEARHE